MTEAVPATVPPAAPSTGRRRERRAPQAAVRQLPYTRVYNHYRPTEVLSADHIEAIHRNALKLLRETGIEVMQEPARRILKAAGAEVDGSNDRVRFESELIERSIAKAPASFEMQARNRSYDIGCGKDEIVFAATGGPAFAHDCDRGKRPGNYEDMVNYLKLVHQLNVVHQEGGCRSSRPICRRIPGISTSTRRCSPSPTRLGNAGRWAPIVSRMRSTWAASPMA